VVAGAPGQLISEFEVNDRAIAIAVEHDAIKSVRVFDRLNLTEISVPAPSELGVMQFQFPHGLGDRDPTSPILHLQFSAPARPPAGFEFDTRTGGALKEVRRSRAWNWFDPAHYEVRRVMATAADGTSIPVPLTYRRDLIRPGGNPVLVVGYGAYGSSLLPDFPNEWVSLIDRGFVYALAHVRGGREMGRSWHDQGSMMDKRNSFGDFIAATDALIGSPDVDPHRVFAHGMSAGGLLVSAVANMRPELYAGIVAEVPFVDVITTMSDAAIPLTTLEYDEWGNPSIEPQYNYMLSYSPYDNVTRQAYPAFFVTGAINDSQVDVHEPAKWVARLRKIKMDHHWLVFLTDMTAGHEGPAGRFGAIESNAQIMAWLLSHLRAP
jgi:oligopeptidase B